MTDYLDSKIGFNAVLKETPSPEEPSCIGFNAVLRKPKQKTAALEFLRASMNTSDIKHVLPPGRLMAAALLIGSALTVQAFPEQIGQQAGHFVSGFNTASEGTRICDMHNITTCPPLRTAGEAMGNIVFKIDKGFTETNTLLPRATR